MTVKEIEESLGNLHEIVSRLNCGCALLDAIRGSSGISVASGDTLSGISDLLECICRDFRADIEYIEREIEKGDVA